MGALRRAAGRTRRRARLRARGAAFRLAARFTPHLAVETPGGVFLVETRGSKLSHKLFVKRRRTEFDVLTRALAVLDREGLRRAGVLVDVGANIGTVSLAGLSAGIERAVACEPEPANLRLLRANVALNDAYEKVAVVAAAITDSPGPVALDVGAGSSGKHHVSATPGPETIAVAGRPLDEVLDALGLGAGDLGLVWIDVEGYEGHVLAGARDALSTGVPLVFEHHAVYLERSGGRELLERELRARYTHVADLRGDGVTELRPVEELAALTAGYAGATDILAVRL